MRALHPSLGLQMLLAGVRATLMLAVLHALALVLFVERPLAAYLCPACAGLVEAAPGLYTDDPAVARRALVQVETAERRVGRVLGRSGARPVLLVCRSEACDKRVAGPLRAPHTLGVAYGWTFVRIAPRGLTEDVLTHELTHVAVHRRIGLIAVATGRLPAWWNEGLATIVATGVPAACPQGRDALPVTPLEWRHDTSVAAGRLYQLAACRTADWLDRHGGFPGAIAMLDDLGRGGAFPPRSSARCGRRHDPRENPSIVGRSPHSCPI